MSLQLAPSGGAYIRREGKRIIRRYDRVSHVLDTGLPLWDGIDEQTLAARAELGTEVHRCGYELARSPEPFELASSYPDHLRGYCFGWLKFQSDSGFKPYILEQPLCSEQYAIAGTPDAIGETFTAPTVIDYTIGARARRKRLQTAVYEKLWKEEQQDRRKFKRIEVHLRPDGTYAYRPHNDPNDWFGFVGLLQFHRWLKATL